MNDTNRQRCTRCKVNLTVDKFKMKRDDSRMKICIECNTKCANADKCPHNRTKSQCIDCNGASICIHKRIRNTCKECKGAGICIHNNIKKILLFFLLLKKEIIE